MNNQNLNTSSLTKVFIPHEEYIWVTGEIISDNHDDNIEVSINDKELPPKERGIKMISLKSFNSNWKSLPLQNTDISEDGVDDMTSLSYLHEPSILDNLRRLVSSLILLVTFFLHPPF